MHVDIVKLFNHILVPWSSYFSPFKICVFFPPVGDVEVPPAHQESQSDHHQHEGQDGPEVSEKLFIHKMVLNSLRPERDLR